MLDGYSPDIKIDDLLKEKFTPDKAESVEE
mgnify:FL=1